MSSTAALLAHFRLASLREQKSSPYPLGFSCYEKKRCLYSGDSFKRTLKKCSSVLLSKHNLIQKYSQLEINNELRQFSDITDETNCHSEKKLIVFLKVFYFLKPNL